MSGRPAVRVVVCGTRFGRAYMAAVDRVPGLRLVAVLARGSPRSRACAEHYGVPLVADVDDLDDGIDLACVVVGGRLNGGPGAELARSLMRRGLHVVQEHPLTTDELAENLRCAAAHDVRYWLSNHYPDVAPVAAFIAAAAVLREAQPVLFVDALTSVIVLNPLLDIVGRVAGRLGPAHLAVVDALGGPTAASPPSCRGVQGVIGGVPTAIRVQNEIDMANGDSSAHVLARVTVVTEGGNLLLADTRGPVLWQPRLFMPGDTDVAVRLDASPARHLDLPGGTVLAGAETARQVVGVAWPEAIGRVLGRVRDRILAGADHRPDGQRQLALSRLTEEIRGQLGPPGLRGGNEGAIVQAAEVIATIPQDCSTLGL